MPPFDRDNPEQASVGERERPLFDRDNPEQPPVGERDAEKASASQNVCAIDLCFGSRDNQRDLIAAAHDRSSRGVPPGSGEGAGQFFMFFCVFHSLLRNPVAGCYRSNASLV